MKISKQKIEFIMAQKRMNRTDVAEKCGFTVQWVSSLLNKGTCRPDTACKIADGLGADLSEIVEL